VARCGSTFITMYTVVPRSRVPSLYCPMKMSILDRNFPHRLWRTQQVGDMIGCTAFVLVSLAKLWVLMFVLSTHQIFIINLLLLSHVWVRYISFHQLQLITEHHMLVSIITRLGVSQSKSGYTSPVETPLFFSRKESWIFNNRGVILIYWFLPWCSEPTLVRSEGLAKGLYQENNPAGSGPRICNRQIAHAAL